MKNLFSCSARNHTIKTFLLIIYIASISACNNTNKNTTNYNNTDSLISKNKKDTVKEVSINKLNILVLPPYDEISNEGISPDIQKYIQIEIAKDTMFNVIKLPLKLLKDVSYFNVFDKKYCKPLINKVKADKIVMSKLILLKRTGNIYADKWSLQLKIYDIKSDKELISKITFNNLTDEEIKIKLSLKRNELISEIRSTANVKK